MSCSPVTLYHILRDLSYWVDCQREWANMKALELHAPETPFVCETLPLPPVKSGEAWYLNQSVPDMFTVWRAVRVIREKYDEVVRNYESEEDWESSAAVYYRIQAVQLAARVVSLAFMDSEKREAKIAEMKKQQIKNPFTNKRKPVEDSPELNDMFRESMDDDNDDIDFDRLFHGDDSNV